MTSRERYKRWLENDYFDEETEEGTGGPGRQPG